MYLVGSYILYICLYLMKFKAAMKNLVTEICKFNEIKVELCTPGTGGTGGTIRYTTSNYYIM